jgi:deoxyuridine 5'-triphosphate nucleotidohydrolase
MIAFNKSGVATKLGLGTAACVVDEDYEGEVHLSLVNTTDHDVSIYPGQKIIQFIVMPIMNSSAIEVNSLKELYNNSTSARGSGGFGSTGI